MPTERLLNVDVHKQRATGLAFRRENSVITLSMSTSLCLWKCNPHYVMSQGCLFVYESFLRGGRMFIIIQDLRVHVAQWFKSANLMIKKRLSPINIFFLRFQVYAPAYVRIWLLRDCRLVLFALQVVGSAQ